MQSYTYEQARDKIKNGDIIFVSNKNTLPAKVVRFFTKSKFSHTGIAFWARIGQDDRLFVVESQVLTSKRIVNISYYDDTELYVVTNPAQWADIAKEAVNRLGNVEYDYLLAAAVGVKDFLDKYFGIRLNCELKDRNGEICSEAVAKLLKLDETLISPERLFEVLTSKYEQSVKFVIKPDAKMAK